MLAASATAEAAGGVEVTPIDNYAQFVNVSRGLLSYADSMDPAPLVDAASGKVMIAANDTSNDQKPVWIRCALANLASCTYTYGDLQPINSGLQLSSVIDATNHKLLSVALGPGLHRCDPDGSGCTFTDISASQVRGSGTNPSAVVDEANGKLLVATNNLVNDEKPSLFRCGLESADLETSYSQAPIRDADVAMSVPDVHRHASDPTTDLTARNGTANSAQLCGIAHRPRAAARRRRNVWLGANTRRIRRVFFRAVESGASQSSRFDGALGVGPLPYSSSCALT